VKNWVKDCKLGVILRNKDRSKSANREPAISKKPWETRECHEKNRWCLEGLPLGPPRRFDVLASKGLDAMEKKRRKDKSAKAWLRLQTAFYYYGTSTKAG